MRRPTQLLLSWVLILTAIGLALLTYIAYELEQVYPSQTRNVWNFTLPLCLIVVAFITLGVIMWNSATRRRPPGHCTQCGYDLTGNQSGACPECGAKAMR